MRRWFPSLVALLPGCWLERVTGEEVPLDPAFYEAVEAAQGMPGEGGGASVPFSDHDGETVVVRGEVTGGDTLLAVDLDVRVPDPTAPGGVQGKGKLLLEAPGPFELTVPVSLGALELQAFQDLAGDGPSPDDPFSSVELEVGDADVGGVELAMAAGAWTGGAGGPVHQQMPVGAPGGDPSAGGPPPGEPGQPGPGEPGSPPAGEPGQPSPVAGSPGAPPPGQPAPPPGGGLGDPFAGHSGPTVTVSGRLLWSGGGTIDLDLFRPDADSPGGRRPLGKLKLEAGDWSMEVPEGYGALGFEAFIDLDGNGPDAGDPRGCNAGGPLTVSDEDVAGVDIELSISPDGAPPTCSPNAPPVARGAPPPRR